ncbi:type II toxin-antitoxin system RelE/ParE family toxin [Rhizobium sp. PAMB 3182]
MLVSFAPAAVQDVEEVGDYIYAENPTAAIRFITELRMRCERIADAPEAGRPRPELSSELRSVPFRRYLIFYSLTKDAVRIERVLHGSRDIYAIFDDV